MNETTAVVATKTVAYEGVFTTKYPLNTEHARQAWLVFDRFHNAAICRYQVTGERDIADGADLVDVLTYVRAQAEQVVGDAQINGWLSLSVEVRP